MLIEDTVNSETNIKNVEFIKSDFTHYNTKLYFRQKLNCAEYAKIAARIYDIKICKTVDTGFLKK